MPKTSLEKYKNPSTNSKLYKKIKKRIPTSKNFVIAFVIKFAGINSHVTWSITGVDVCISSVTYCAIYKEELEVAVVLLMEDEVQDDERYKWRRRKWEVTGWVVRWTGEWMEK